MAASFLTCVNRGGAESWNNFTGPASLDLSRFADRELRHSAGLGPRPFALPTLNRFTAQANPSRHAVPPGRPLKS